MHRASRLLQSFREISQKKHKIKKSFSIQSQSFYGHLQEVKDKRDRIQLEKYNSMVEMVRKNEDRHSEKQRELMREMERVYSLQCAWLTVIKQTQRARILMSKLNSLMGSKLRKRAALRIEVAWIFFKKMTRRKNILRLVRIMARSWYVLSFRIRRKRKSAEIIASFLNSLNNMMDTNRLIKRLKLRVLFLQRTWRNFSTIREAQIELLLRQWNRSEALRVQKLEEEFEKQRLSNLRKQQEEKIKMMHGNWSKRNKLPKLGLIEQINHDQRYVQKAVVHVPEFVLSALGALCFFLYILIVSFPSRSTHLF